jgi:hypothetical protein
MKEKPRIEYISQQQLRRLFNEQGLWERALRGELRQAVVRQRPAASTLPFPDGTQTMIVDYYDDIGVRLARVHQYMLPDGSIGGSGRPDPKLVLLDGISYRVRLDQPQV